MIYYTFLSLLYTHCLKEKNHYNRTRTDHPVVYVQRVIEFIMIKLRGKETVGPTARGSPCR